MQSGDQQVRLPADRADLALPGVVRVGGVDVRFGVSGAGERDLLLLHGHSAHHVWWHGVAPLLEPRWRVIQMDLSGHGDSGHRAEYSHAVWRQDVLAVLDAAASTRPLLVGHSLGGHVLATFAAQHPARTAGLLLLDSSTRPRNRYRPPRGENVRLSTPGREVHGFPTQEELLARFRLMPPQPHPEFESLLEPAARFSTRIGASGWTWKHDRLGVTRTTDEEVRIAVAGLDCPVGVLFGAESSVVDVELAEFTAMTAPGEVLVAAVPGAHHHLILEQPELCARLMDEMARTMLAGSSSLDDSAA